MTTVDPRLKTILDQASGARGIPVVLWTRKGEPLWVVIPYANNNREWLGRGHSRQLQRFAGNRFPPHWTVPKTWLEELTQRLVTRFGATYVVQALRTKETCAAACWNARGLDCECSCMGAHHGTGRPGGRWYEVSETCAVSWGRKRLHYKKLVLAPAREPPEG